MSVRLPRMVAVILENARPSTTHSSSTTLATAGHSIPSRGRVMVSPPLVNRLSDSVRKPVHVQLA